VNTPHPLRAALLVILAAAAWLPAHEPADSATPDCGTSRPEPFPALQREKQLARLGADAWQAAGRRGRGLKVAVLDSGFRGYRDHLGHALPEKVTTRSFRLDGDLEAKESQHGILCAEVIHALAPDAELLLANWEPDRYETFLAAAEWARRQGARVISCSVIMPTWSDGEGNGPVHEGLAKILGCGGERGDVLCFASAGNTAQRHWAGAARPGDGGWHQWEPRRTLNRLEPWSSEPMSVELYWSGDADYHLSVVDADAGTEVDASPPRPGVTRSMAVVRFVPAAGVRYAVRLRCVRGEGKFHLVALGGGLALTTPAGSIAFPADGPEVIAVGAVDADGQRTPYSSCGPNSKEPKPDLVAEVPFPSLWRDRPFTGTSAAAPQAAGLAAILWSRHPDWTAKQVRQCLRDSARDLGPAGHDWETGYGLIRLPDEGKEVTARGR
jgi:hypothetical protein